jgi:formimidoylglutamate deiminase
LRWLEYGQRLLTRHRNVAVRSDSPSVGETLLRGTLSSRDNATGFAMQAAGDRVTLDTGAPQFAGMTAEDAVDRWIFSGNRNLVRDVEVGGVQVVADGCHRDRAGIANRYRRAIETLLAD